MVANRDGFSPKHFNVGEIKAEEGMGQVLKEKRDILLANVINCKPDEFDSTWELYFGDYMSSGGKAIIEERKAKYEQYFE